MPKTHSLKTWPRFFRDVKSGAKTFEIRKNDRDFCIGDILELHEYHPVMHEYTGAEPLIRRVTYVLNEAPYVPAGYVCMSIERVSEDGSEINKP